MDFIANNLPDTISMGSFFLLILIGFGGAFVTAAFGIGGGALGLAFLAAILPPAALIPLHGVVQFMANASRAGLLWRQIFWPSIPFFALGSLVGALVGGSVVVEMEPHLILLMVGLFVLWSVLGKTPRWVGRWPALTGVVSSFLTMFFGATGAFVAAYTKSLNLQRHAHVATHGMLMTVQHSVKVAVFAGFGFAFAPWWLVLLAMVVAGYIGTLLGKLVLDKLSDGVFRRFLDGVLILLSLRLIWQGIHGFFA